MKRRDIIKYTAYATGAALSAPLISSLLVSCQSEVAATATTEGLAFFSGKEMEVVKKIANLILPKTDSPSATEVGVHEMIDHMVGNVYAEKERADYKTAFQALSQLVADKSTEELANLVTQLNNKDAATPESAQKGFMQLKQQTIAYYLSSKEIGMNYLNYLPVPGEYEACISLADVGGKAWAM